MMSEIWDMSECHNNQIWVGRGEIKRPDNKKKCDAYKNIWNSIPVDELETTHFMGRNNRFIM